MDLFLIAVNFKTGDFFQDMIIPTVAVVIVLLLILNSLLNKWGFTLW